ncbi:MAG: hypothetical protein QNK05_16200, partial [Myxococcota bacterium]|nr:hypothetical protein [Myxococcota bacterium]
MLASPIRLLLAICLASLSSPAAAVFHLGSLDAPDSIQRLARSGDTLVATVPFSPDALVIFDVSDPSNPAQVSTVPTSGGLSGSGLGLAIDGSVAYAGISTPGGPALASYDLSNPASVVELDSIGVAASPIVDLAIDGATAYAVSLSGPLATIRVVDISNPSSLVDTGVSFGGGTGLDFAQAVDVDAGLALVATPSSLDVFDVSTPTSPSAAGSVPLPDAAVDVLVVGTTAYVAATSSVRIIDLSTPGLPAEIGSFSLPASGLAIEGDSLFVTNQIGVVVLDVGDPTQPGLMAQFVGLAESAAIDVSGGVAVTGGTGISLEDVSNPQFPRLIDADVQPGVDFTETVVRAGL